MENIVNVEGTELDVREYNGQMVVTFDDIDLVHKRPSGTARKAFNRNKKRFINGVDYIVLEKENSNVHRVDIRNIDIPNRGITVFTESGYLMLVKPFKSQCECRSHCHSNNTSYQFISQCKHFSSVGSQKVGNNLFRLNIHSQIVG